MKCNHAASSDEIYLEVFIIVSQQTWGMHLLGSLEDMQFLISQQKLDDNTLLNGD